MIFPNSPPADYTCSNTAFSFMDNGPVIRAKPQSNNVFVCPSLNQSTHRSLFYNVTEQCRSVYDEIMQVDDDCHATTPAAATISKNNRRQSKSVDALRHTENLPAALKYPDRSRSDQDFGDVASLEQEDM